MKPQKVVNVDEFDKLRKCIDEIASGSMTLSCFSQTIPMDRMELDEKIKEVLDYINNNPNIIKKRVVDNFKNKPGLSRRVVFKILQRLEELNLILVKVDSVNKRHHHLFVNHVDILSSLITVLEYFKKLYFGLIYKTRPFIEEKAVGITPVDLVECLMMLYKFMKDKFSDYFLWHRKICDNDNLYGKFGIIHESIQEIVTELSQSLVDADFMSRNEEMERFLSMSRSDALGPENLTFIISTFERCGLRGYAEPIIDFLWILFYRKLPLLYLEYANLSIEGKLNDWRDIVKGEFITIPYKKKVLYCPPFT